MIVENVKWQFCLLLMNFVNLCFHWCQFKIFLQNFGLFLILEISVSDTKATLKVNITVTYSTIKFLCIVNSVLVHLSLLATSILIWYLLARLRAYSFYWTKSRRHLGRLQLCQQISEQGSHKWQYKLVRLSLSLISTLV